MKKAQMEIYGLVMIILILLVAGTWFFILELNRQPPSVSASVVQPILAQNFLNSVMNSETSMNMKLKQVISNCYDDRKNEICSKDDYSDCCDYASKAINMTLTNTLSTWNVKYRLNVNDDILLSNDARCNDNADKEQPGTYYIPSNVPINVRLDICSKII